ncbi:MAG: N-6 DNA methylase [Chloroflexaceae bacterium]|nr:N-6 DNA methylase [Chloroflexaceae bacterium]
MAIDIFLTQIAQALQQGQATEHTYRPALKQLFETVLAPVSAINEPKKASFGAPDFLLERHQTPLGHVEAKDVGLKLDHFYEDSEREQPRTPEGKQLKRYRANLANLLYTDGLVWYWFVNGELRTAEPVCLATVVKPSHKLKPIAGAAQHLLDLLHQFAEQQITTISHPRDLAARLAQSTRWLYDLILTVFEQEGPEGDLHIELDAFRETLLPALKPDEFADMYAQTIVYGLFSARIALQEQASFTRHDAARGIPVTNPFLRKLFQSIGGYDLDERIAWLVDHCANLLARTDMGAVLHDFGKATMQQDPVVHFYETFLSVYNPKMRETRGVYYTPEPVVSYIVRSVDQLLQQRFQRADGLADASTVILDPATGTATFLAAVVQSIYATQQAQGMEGYWDSYVADKLLPRLFGFELLMAPYAVAHLKLGWLLQQYGYTFGHQARLGIYLTNALESLPPGQHYLAFKQFIAEEGTHAEAVKHKQRVMVVLGNPPYSGHSANKGEWIGNLVRDYYQVDGKPLGERNSKWLQDDYVKFIRFGQWRIHQTGEGILAFISNNGYLDNPTFRGMRQHLLHEFDTIYLLNLHGNSKKKERAPDGSPDENVFDIQQGVAIGIFVKQQHAATEPATVYYADLWGERESKYEQLATLDSSTTVWQQLVPASPWYRFVPHDGDLSDEYEQGWQSSDMMPVASVGMVTGQDKRTIAFSYQECLHLAHEQQMPEEAIKPVLYRLFDQRYMIYHSDLVTRLRHDVTNHLLTGPNLALIVARSGSAGQPFGHMFCTQHSVMARLYLDAACVAHFSPLYLYPNGQFPELLLHHENGHRPNFASTFISDVTQRLGLAFIADGQGDLEHTVGPEDIFHYIYAVFHSPTYRERYAELLKIDFPRVPLTHDRALFAALAAHGAELVDLHLLRLPGQAGVGGAGGAAILHNPQTQGIKAPLPGSNMVDKVQYIPPQHDQPGRVAFNPTQSFAGITPETWEMRIGGYQPLEKWLKDRKGRTLSHDDILHYRRMVIALQETRRLMAAIDGLIPAWPLV